MGYTVTSKLSQGLSLAENKLLSNPGLTYLKSCDGFYNGKIYSGAGNWLNDGTAGAIPLIATGGITFTTDHFTFNGTTGVFNTSGDSYDIPNKLNDFTVGLVMSYITTATATGFIAGKGTGVNSGYHTQMNGVSRAPLILVRDASANTPSALASTAPAVGQKFLLTAGGTAAGLVFCGVDTTVVTGTDSRTASSDNSLVFHVSGSNTGTNVIPFDVYCVFIKNGPMTNQNRLDVMAYHGF